MIQRISATRHGVRQAETEVEKLEAKTVTVEHRKGFDDKDVSVWDDRLSRADFVDVSFRFPSRLLGLHFALAILETCYFRSARLIRIFFAVLVKSCRAEGQRNERPTDEFGCEVCAKLAAQRTGQSGGRCCIMDSSPLYPIFPRRPVLGDVFPRWE